MPPPTRRQLHDLFRSLGGEDAVIARVGGRYADILYAHDPRLETAVEIHSSWGTPSGFSTTPSKCIASVSSAIATTIRGVPARLPGASSFGAIGGLTCYLMPELTRDAI